MFVYNFKSYLPLHQCNDLTVRVKDKKDRVLDFEILFFIWNLDGVSLGNVI